MRYGERDRLKVRWCWACRKWEVKGYQGTARLDVLTQHDTWNQALTAANRRVGIR